MLNQTKQYASDSKIVKIAVSTECLGQNPTIQPLNCHPPPSNLSNFLMSTFGSKSNK